MSKTKSFHSAGKSSVESSLGAGIRAAARSDSNQQFKKQQSQSRPSLFSRILSFTPVCYYSRLHTFIRRHHVSFFMLHLLRQLRSTFLADAPKVETRIATTMSSSSDLSDLSSGLSSLNNTPSPPPCDYPSPISSQDTSNDSSSRQSSRKRTSEDRETPPLPKRRKTEPKPRTTQYLNLRPPPFASQENQTEQLALLTKLLRKRRKIVVVAGAGISTAAGIPDFRSKTGLFETLRTDHNLKSSGKELFDVSVYRTDEGTTQFHAMVRNLSHQASVAKPTAFHHMLASLAKSGQLLRLYTQNVDGIDTSLPPLSTVIPLNAKGPWPRTIQLHGGLEKMVCTKCHTLSDFEPALFDGSTAPACPNCMDIDRIRINHAGKRSHGIGCLRPRMVLYSEQSPDADAIGAVSIADLRARPDAIIVVGTSMKIPGVKQMVKEMCRVVRDRRDGLAVWINQDPPPKEYEDCWDLVIDGDCDKVAEHAAMKHWDDTSVDYEDTTESDAERAKRRDGEIRVIVDSPHRRVERTALPTPAPSPKPREKIPAKKPLSIVDLVEGNANAQRKVRSEQKIKKRVPKPKTKEIRPNASIKQTFKTTKSNRHIPIPKPPPSKPDNSDVTSRSPILPTMHPPSPSSEFDLGLRRILPNIFNPGSTSKAPDRRTPPSFRRVDSPPMSPPQLSPNTLFTDLRRLPSPKPSMDRLASPPRPYITPPSLPDRAKHFRKVSNSPIQSLEVDNQCFIQDKIYAEAQSSSPLTSPLPFSPPPPSTLRYDGDRTLPPPIPSQYDIERLVTLVRPVKNPTPTEYFNLHESRNRPSTPHESSRRMTSSFIQCSTPSSQATTYETRSPSTPEYSPYSPWYDQARQNMYQEPPASPSPASRNQVTRTSWLPPSTPERQIVFDPEDLVPPEYSDHTAYEGYDETSNDRRSSSYDDDATISMPASSASSRPSSPSPSPSSPFLRPSIESVTSDNDSSSAQQAPSISQLLPLYNNSFLPPSTPKRRKSEAGFIVLSAPKWSPLSSSSWQSKVDRYNELVEWQKGRDGNRAMEEKEIDGEREVNMERRKSFHVRGGEHRYGTRRRVKSVGLVL